MNYLLKIVQGANAGAEIALAEGVVTFGSSDACDIVLNDSSLPAEAFSLEATDAGVNLKVLPDGESKKVELYTLFAFGNSTFAVGENGVAWPELKKPAPPVAEPDGGRSGETPIRQGESAPDGEGPNAGTGDGSAAGRTDGSSAVESGVSTPQSGSEMPPSRRRHGCAGCLLVFILLLVFFAAGYFLALRYGRVCGKYAEDWGLPFASAIGDFSAGADNDSPVGGSAAPPLQEEVKDGGEVLTSGDLTSWAAAGGVSVVEKDGETVLSGNFAKQADKYAFSHDAYGRDVNLVLDLSDDETLKAGVEAVLFVLTDGRIKLESATNRVVKLVGKARSRDELLNTVAAICTDVNHVRVVDDTAVVCGDGIRSAEPTRYRAVSAPAARRHPFVTPAAKPGMPAPKCPVAGVILMPYPCLVLRDGSRAAEGSMVGDFKVERITAEKVTLKRGEETVTWKP